VSTSAIRTVAVIGAGTMGHGIAQVAAMAGWPVRISDAQAGAAERALQRIRANLDGAVQRGKASAELRDDALARLSAAGDAAEAARGADLVIEAVPEQLELKRNLLREVERVAAPGAVLASNTSSLSIAAIASGAGDPARVIGMHFFNPVHLMRLVEIVVHEGTSVATRETALAAAGRMGKEPILVRDSPGFASSRLGVALGLEAMRMLESGVATAEDIDKAMALGYNHPMGPLRLTDLVGLDTRLAIARYLHETLDSPVFRPPAILERLVAEGRLGRKSGQGFYTWTD
jgi:3-hydroxybutyryl-CoA dehydrogenase